MINTCLHLQEIVLDKRVNKFLGKRQRKSLFLVDSLENQGEKLLVTAWGKKLG
jgi:hypothetical protein